ncbi:citron homology (CNH) domain protein [Artemisia annua]|uniref:Citron homology (CNH) domain protein n=1 Tax=Artemisia annua TaxID=35608 RepID=A0A2U1P7R1_ARTAN|nr:citron homology (CNH) domain protein [Artemisia annua]
MLAMKVLASCELLLSLSETIVIHRLPNLETQEVFAKAKGANVCAWDDVRGFLCFARQKRVCVFRHNGERGFVEVKEYGVPDVVKSMCWCGENICMGIRKGYMILNVVNGAVTEVFQPGRSAPPLAVSLPSGELLLGKDNIGVLVDQNGKLVPEGRICWSEAPAVVVIQKPYAIALLPKHIEIRLLRVPYPLIQTIGLRNIRGIKQGNNGVIASLDQSVYGLFPVPLGAQIVQLTASGNFEEALVLCKFLPPEDSGLRASKEQSIHIRYAHHLFGNGRYEEAMEHFVASQVDLTHVLSLYPSIVLPMLLMSAERENVDVAGESYLSRGSSVTSDDMDSSPTSLPEFDESCALESKKMSHNTLMALIKFLLKKRPNIVGKAAAETTEEVVSDAVVHTFDTHENRRSKKSTKGRFNIPTHSGAREVAAILDTALLQALLLTGQIAAALDLLKGFNYCDLHLPELALSYCDRVYEAGLNQQSGKIQGNIYLTLMQVYLNPRKTTKKVEKRITSLVSSPSSGNLKAGWSAVKAKGKGLGRKIALIEGAEDTRIRAYSSDGGKSDGGRSDGGRSDYDTDDVIEEGSSAMMLDEVLDVLIQRWDRVHGAKALRLLPKETKLQKLYPFLGPLMKKTSESYRNFSVIKSLRQLENLQKLYPFLGPLMKKTSESYRNFSVIKSLRQLENLQVKDDLYSQRKAELKITSESVCSLCNKKIGTSVFAVYPNGNTIVHFVCFRDSQNMKATRKGSSLRRR